LLLISPIQLEKANYGTTLQVKDLIIVLLGEGDDEHAAASYYPGQQWWQLGFPDALFFPFANHLRW